MAYLETRTNNPKGKKMSKTIEQTKTVEQRTNHLYDIVNFINDLSTHAQVKEISLAKLKALYKIAVRFKAVSGKDLEWKDVLLMTCLGVCTAHVGDGTTTESFDDKTLIVFTNKIVTREDVKDYLDKQEVIYNVEQEADEAMSKIDMDNPDEVGKLLDTLVEMR